MWHDDEKDILNIIMAYYLNLFSSQGPRDFDDILSCISPRVSLNMNDSLSGPYSHVEVREAIFSMKPHKAPWPERIHAFFYQRYWKILANDVVSFVNDFLRSNL